MPEGPVPIETQESDTSEAEARRKFLRNCAKFASGTPPAVALLLSASRQAQAAEGDPPHCNKSFPQGPPCSIPPPEGDDGTTEG